MQPEKKSHRNNKDIYTHDTQLQFQEHGEEVCEQQCCSHCVRHFCSCPCKLAAEGRVLQILESGGEPFYRKVQPVQPQRAPNDTYPGYQ